MEEPEASSDSSTPDGNPKFDQESTIDMQLKCIIEENLSFHVFESGRFLQLFQDCLQPKYEWVSSTTTLKRTAFDHYMKAKKDLIKYFDNFQSKVSLSIHEWKTSPGSFFSPYICITCHWIDPDTWKMSRRVIAVEQTGYPYKPENVFEFIMRSVSEFKVKDKIMSITFDDSVTDYITVIEMLKTELNPLFNALFFHTKCACHILNSMVKSSLEYVAPVITKFQNLFVYAFRSRKAKEFKEFVIEKGAEFSVIPASIPHEWDTIYKTLALVVKQKSLLVEYYAICGESSDIDDNDWETIKSLVGILKVFHSSMLRLQVSVLPTSQIVLEEILVIANMFKEYKKNPFWKPLIQELQDKLLKYYETMPTVFTCATALNPKIGIGGVENILEDIAGFLGLDYGNYSRVSMEKCSSALNEVFDYYDKKYKSRAREIVPVNTRNIILESVSRKRARTSISNELELYSKTDFQNVMVSDEFVNRNNMLLEWWKTKGRLQYPIMAEMAHDLLTVQASTLSFGFVFCLNGRVLDEMCTYKISPRWLEMRGFLKEHFAYGGQNMSLLKDVGGESKDVVLLYEDSSDEEVGMSIWAEKTESNRKPTETEPNRNR